MVCDKVVCERWCVTKSGVTKLCVAGGGAGGGGGAGYRIKNKNPTQRCGEKQTLLKMGFDFAPSMILRCTGLSRNQQWVHYGKHRGTINSA